MTQVGYGQRSRIYKVKTVVQGMGRIREPAEKVGARLGAFSRKRGCLLCRDQRGHGKVERRSVQDQTEAGETGGKIRSDVAKNGC